MRTGKDIISQQDIVFFLNTYVEQGSVGLGVSRCVIFTGRVCFSNKPPLPHHTPPLYLDLCSTILVARSTTGLALSFTVSMSRDIVLSIVQFHYLLLPTLICL